MTRLSHEGLAVTDTPLAPDSRVTLDLRGETLLHEEPSRRRRTRVICTFGLAEAERAALIDRLADHARNRLGPNALRIEG